mgnify:FL=1
MLPAVLAALGGMYAQYRGAHEATKGLDNNLDKVAGYMQPYKAGLDKYNTMSQDYMDPTSGMNQQALGQFQQSGMDFASAQNRMNSRNMSSGGMGGYSGLQGAQNQQFMGQAQNQAMDSWRNNLLNNKNTGISLMDKYIQGQKGYGETMAQGWLQNDQLKRQMQQAKWSGLGQGLMSFAGGGGE